MPPLPVDPERRIQSPPIPLAALNHTLATDPDAAAHPAIAAARVALQAAATR